MMLDSTDRFVILVDSISKYEMGHYWQMSANFRRVFLESGINFVFLNPHSSEAQREDSLTSSQNEKSSYITLDLGDGFFEKTLDYVQNVCNDMHEKQIHVIFLWLPVVPLEHFRNIVRISNSVVVSGITFPKSLTDESFDYHFQEEFNQNERCKKLWVWSDSLSNVSKPANSKIRKLPEYHPSASATKDISEDILGFFGKLNSKRGLSDVCVAALFNPKLKFEIKGYGYQGLRMWRSSRFPALHYTSWKRKPLAALLTLLVNILLKLCLLLPNVKFDKTPFTTQEELQSAIGKCSAVFYAAKLPYSSGITLTSLATGVPVIWFGSKGEAVNQLEKGYPNGRIARFQLFIPGHISQKVKQLKDCKPVEIFSWEQFKEEVLDSL